MFNRLKYKINKNKYYILFAIIIGIFIIKYNYVVGDDLNYKAKVIKMGTWNFIVDEFSHWSGRLSMIIIPALVRYNLYTWKILNILVAFLYLKGFSYYYKSDLSIEEKLKLDKMTFACFFFIFPYTITSAIVWLSGSYQYLWAVTAFIYAMFPFYKIIFISKELKFSKLKWCLYYFAVFCAAYIEQEFLVMFVLSTIVILLVIKNKEIIKKEKLKIFFYYVFFLINLGISRFSKGFNIRIAKEIRWYPNWTNMPFIYRFYEAVNLTNRHVIWGSNILFLILILFLSILVYKKWGTKMKVLYIPLGYIILKILPLDFFSNNIMTWYFNFENFYTADRKSLQTLTIEKSVNYFLYDTTKVIQDIKIPKFEYLPAVISFSIIIFISFIIYNIFNDRKKGILVFLVYWAGFFSVYILSFMPAIYAIGSRAFFLMDSLILFIISQLYLELKLEYQIDKNKYFKVFLVVILLLSFLIILSYNSYLKQFVYL